MRKVLVLSSLINPLDVFCHHEVLTTPFSSSQRPLSSIVDWITVALIPIEESRLIIQMNHSITQEREREREMKNNSNLIQRATYIRCVC